jgi:hypothetical protein
MVCELVREAKTVTKLEKKDERLDGLTKELEHVMIMLSQFQDEEGDFKFMHERTRSILQEFVKRRSGLQDKKEAPFAS